RAEGRLHVALLHACRRYGPACYGHRSMPVARWPADDGRLAGDRRGPGDGEQLVFVHGFTQTRASWSAIRHRFDDRYATVAIDAPGHGDSAAVDLDLDDGAAAL